MDIFSMEYHSLEFIPSLSTMEDNRPLRLEFVEQTSYNLSTQEDTLFLLCSNQGIAGTVSRRAD